MSDYAPSWGDLLISELLGDQRSPAVVIVD